MDVGIDKCQIKQTFTKGKFQFCDIEKSKTYILRNCVQIKLKAIPKIIGKKHRKEKNRKRIKPCESRNFYLSFS